MAHDDDGYTALQAAEATTMLRAELGFAPQRFGAEQFVGMISDEIEQLRAAGRTDADIATLLADGTGVALDADEITRYYAGPEQRGGPPDR